MKNEKKQFAVNLVFPMSLMETAKLDFWKDPSTLSYNITIRDYAVFNSVLPECHRNTRPININIEQVIMDIKKGYDK